MRSDGAGGLGMHELARRLGMKAPSLYTYFDGKEALYDEIFREGMREYRARQDALEARHGINLEAVGAILSDYVHFADENPELYSLLFERPVPGFVPSEASMVEARGLIEDSNRRVQTLIDRGLVRQDMTASQLRDTLLVIMHGLTSLRRANEPGATINEGRFGPLIPHMVAMLLAAWQPRGGATGTAAEVNP